MGRSGTTRHWRQRDLWGIVVIPLVMIGPPSSGPQTTWFDVSPSNARWSPDGGSVVFYAEIDGQTDIFLRQILGGKTVRLTDGLESDYGPDFSPDGERIAFYSGQDGEFKINLMRVDGSRRRVLGCGGSYEGNPHFSPDGSQIAFSSNRDGNHEIYVIDLSTSDCRRLTDNESNDWTPRFSPDGRLISFASDRAGDFSIYTMALDGSDVQLRADVAAHDYYPDWSPDGSQLAFFSGADFDTFQVYVFDLTLGEATQVTSAPLTATNPAWAPHGSDLLVGATLDGHDKLMVVGSDGTGLRELFGPR